jgi:hypothetical protein
MSSPFIDKAKQMLRDLSYITYGIINSGAMEVNDREYRLSFNIRRDVYEEIVVSCEMKSCLNMHYDKRKPYSSLYGLPVFVIDDFDAPPVSLCIHPAVVDLTDDNETKKENQQ